MVMFNKHLTRHSWGEEIRYVCSKRGEDSMICEKGKFRKFSIKPLIVLKYKSFVEDLKVNSILLGSGQCLMVIFVIVNYFIAWKFSWTRYIGEFMAAPLSCTYFLGHEFERDLEIDFRLAADHQIMWICSPYQPYFDGRRLRWWSWCM